MQGRSKHITTLLAALLFWATCDARGTESPHSASSRLPIDEAAQSGALPLDQQLDVAVAIAAGEDADAADRLLASVIGDPGFESLPRNTRRKALATAGWNAVRLDELPRARDLYLAATQADPGDPDDWYQLSLLEGDMGQHEASAQFMLRLARKWPELLDDLSDQHINQLIHKTNASSPIRLELLQALFDAPWTANGLGASHLWFELALTRVERGEAEAARAVMARIDSPLELARLRADRRFDALVERDSEQFDLARAARNRADDLRLKAMLVPERLNLLMEFSSAVLVIGDNTNVLAMTDAALAMIDEGDENSPFEDLDDQVWLMNNRAIALRRLGRVDEALEQLEHASRLTEDGEPNVSQALNLGQFYCSLGRPNDALKAVAHVGEMSAYGRMVQVSVQHCARRRGGDLAGADRALAYLREHREESQEHLLDALIEADRMDEAAATLIELLQSPRDRSDALIVLQDFHRQEPLPGDVQYAARRMRLLARADVQAAVNRVGRIERHDIQVSGGID